MQLIHTLASLHAARRRQYIAPEPKPSSWGRYTHLMPVGSMNRIPLHACRSGIRGRPSNSFGSGVGSNGSTRYHSSSETARGRDSLFPMTGPKSNQTDSHVIDGFFLEPLRRGPPNRPAMSLEQQFMPLDGIR